MDIPKNGVFFFDSGIGGLTVLAECKKQMPSETFYYYGDNTRAPYGP
jgi:glutamate racemase